MDLGLFPEGKKVQESSSRVGQVGDYFACTPLGPEGAQLINRGTFAVYFLS